MEKWEQMNHHTIKFMVESRLRDQEDTDYPVLAPILFDLPAIAPPPKPLTLHFVRIPFLMLMIFLLISFCGFMVEEVVDNWLVIRGNVVRFVLWCWSFCVGIYRTVDHLVKQSWQKMYRGLRISIKKLGNLTVQCINLFKFSIYVVQRR